jgi:3-methyladenine DNA glycosylase AlkC
MIGGRDSAFKADRGAARDRRPRAPPICGWTPGPRWLLPQWRSTPSIRSIDMTSEALKDHFGVGVVERLATEVAAVHAALDRGAFVREALTGFEALALMARGGHLAEVLGRHLPASFPEAISVLMCSLGPQRPAESPMGGFYYLPHTEFVARFGLEHADTSMAALHELTQRFTAEFALRPFIEREPQRVFQTLQRWVTDPSEHVRRCVSEATRPRLPWGRRLRALQADPSPSLPLLEQLRDDPSGYVRRSVANHLNDLGKDHPELLLDIARRWMADAGPDRRGLLQHALRSRLKAGDREALALFGCEEPPNVRIDALELSPHSPRVGDTLRLGLRLHCTSDRTQTLNADLCIGFVKADGRVSTKVFRLRRFDLAPGQSVLVKKSIFLRDLSTRRHYPGWHPVGLRLNGHDLPLGGFQLRA